MSHRFQRIMHFNHTELHPYPSQYNPCRKVTVRLHPLLVRCCLLCRPVGGVNIWPIGRGIPWGNHGCLPALSPQLKKLALFRKRYWTLFILIFMRHTSCLNSRHAAVLFIYLAFLGRFAATLFFIFSGWLQLGLELSPLLLATYAAWSCSYNLASWS